MQAEHTSAEKIVANIEKVIVGKHSEVELAVMALVAGGHLLIEDIPGVGKTMLARSLAHSTGCTFGRIQFTPDLLPADITGGYFFNRSSNAIALPISAFCRSGSCAISRSIVSGPS